MSTGPEMVYFPIGGRGELTRLIAVRSLSCCPASARSSADPPTEYRNGAVPLSRWHPFAITRGPDSNLVDCARSQAVGGVDLTESFPGPDWKEKIDPSFFGSLPILKHGDLALAQSLGGEPLRTKILLCMDAALGQAAYSN